MLWNSLNQTVELGWDFYLPVIMFVGLIALAVPVWAAIGAAAITMLVMSGDLPLSLVGESLFHRDRRLRPHRCAALHPDWRRAGPNRTVAEVP